MLEVRDLTKRFGGAAVVDHVNFTMRPGEITGYLGPNGSGKSTTVKMMTGLLHPSEGQVLFNGRNIRGDATGFKQRLGYVPEEPNLYGYLTGLEYLQLAGGFRGLPEDRVLQKANELLELLSLRDARWVPISAYSKGMKQRVLVAAALLHDPDVLIFDKRRAAWISPTRCCSVTCCAPSPPGARSSSLFPTCSNRWRRSPSISW